MRRISRQFPVSSRQQTVLRLINKEKIRVNPLNPRHPRSNYAIRDEKSAEPEGQFFYKNNRQFKKILKNRNNSHKAWLI